MEGVRSSMQSEQKDRDLFDGSKLVVEGGGNKNTGNNKHGTSAGYELF